MSTIQTGDIIAATDSLTIWSGQLADRSRLLDKALQRHPDALSVSRTAQQPLPMHWIQLEIHATGGDSGNRPRKTWSRNCRSRAGAASLAAPGPALTRS